MSRGRIRKALSGFYYVDTGERTVTCRARGKFRQEGRSPLVGDWVEVKETGEGEGMVWEIEPRRSAFDRPAAANVDQLVAVASLAVPVTDPFLIDRVSVIAALKGCGWTQWKGLTLSYIQHTSQSVHYWEVRNILQYLPISSKEKGEELADIYAKGRFSGWPEKTVERQIQDWLAD